MLVLGVDTLMIQTMLQDLLHVECDQLKVGVWLTQQTVARNDTKVIKIAKSHDLNHELNREMMPFLLQ